MQEGDYDLAAIGFRCCPSSGGFIGGAADAARHFYRQARLARHHRHWGARGHHIHDKQNQNDRLLQSVRLINNSYFVKILQQRCAARIQG
jgi:hypothetical protein